MIVIALCIPLIGINQWPIKLKKYVALYWYATLWYCLPFLFTFLLLKNNFSFTWSLNAITVIMLSVLLLDILALLIILPSGILAGWLAFVLTNHAVFHTTNSIVILITYTSPIFFGAVFAYKKMQMYNEKLKAIAESIVHELLTPLRTINASAKGLKLYLARLFAFS